MEVRNHAVDDDNSVGVSHNEKPQKVHFKSWRWKMFEIKIKEIHFVHRDDERDKNEHQCMIIFFFSFVLLFPFVG